MKQDERQLGKVLLGQNIDPNFNKVDQNFDFSNRIVSSVQRFVRSFGLIIALTTSVNACSEKDYLDNNSLQGLSESDVEKDKDPEYVPIKFTIGSDGLTIRGYTEELVSIVIHFFDSDKKLIGDEIGQGFLCQNECIGVLTIPEGSEYAKATFHSDGKIHQMYNYPATLSATR